jgi:hypothetical protein
VSPPKAIDGADDGRVFGYLPLERPRDARWRQRRAQGRQSNIQFTPRGWAAMHFIRSAAGLSTRSQAVDAALHAFALNLGMPEWGAPPEAVDAR